MGEFKFRINLLPFLMLCAIIITLSRLFFLQIIKGGQYRSLADSNRISQSTMIAGRGIIYDRNAYPLVRNIPGFRIKKEGKTRVITRDEALKLQTKDKSTDLQIDTLREYIYPEVFSHVLGFVGENDKQDLVGKAGLEKRYNNILTGNNGERLVEVDSNQKELRLLGEVKPRAGQDLLTTLDLPLQKAAFEAMSEVERGAVVATNPRTGEVLVLFSKPTFDPNTFTIGERGGATAQQILTDSNKPLLNRAIAGVYPPGSTFKIVTAAAGLENGAITKDAKIEDIGILQVGKFSFPNWYFSQYGKLEGSLDIVGAIKRSNDIFFYKTAEFTGIDKLEEMAKKFGIGNTLGIDIEGEEKGLFPNDTWKKKTIGEGWFLGDTYHVGIGQGYLLTTPLQMNAWTLAIANGGTLYQPHLIKDEKPKIKDKNFLKSETIGLIKEGMKEACASGGTGWPLFNFKVKGKELEVACKTGTAEFGDPKGKTHAWFTVFAPVDDPQIVVTVLVEGGGEGSNVAAPIAKKILEEWFAR